MIIHALYGFVVSGLALMVPLYLIDLDISLAGIGIILSLSPLSFLFMRLFLAGVADEAGTKKIDVVYSVSNLIAISLYTFVISPVSFAAAAIFEGIRNSGFWSVVRTEILLANDDEDRGEMLTKFSNIRFIADGLGKVFVGLIIFYLAFQPALELLIGASFVLFLLIMVLEKPSRRHLHIDQKFLSFIFKKHPKSFWQASLLETLAWVPYNIFSFFVFPLFLYSEMKLDYFEIGFLTAVMQILVALFSHFFLKLQIPKNDLFLIVLFAAASFILLPIYPNLLIPLIFSMGFGMGATTILSEYIVSDQVYRSRSISTDIAVFFSPVKILEFLVYSLGGIVLAVYGFAPLYFFFAISVAVFAILGRSIVHATH